MRTPSRVLIVCTANRCRSPMAESLLRAHLDAQGVAAEVASVGRLEAGQPASSGAVRAMAARGVDLGAHRSALLTAEAVDGADLVLGMAREHVREVANLVPAALPRTFTLKELVRRAARSGGRRPQEDLGDWLLRLADGRRPVDLLGSNPRDDVADPIGGPDAGYAAVAAELDHLTERLVALAFPCRQPAWADR